MSKIHYFPRSPSAGGSPPFDFGDLKLHDWP